MIKKFLCIYLLFCLSFTFFACKDSEYSDALSCEELMRAAVEASPTEGGYEPMSEGRLSYSFGDLEYDDCAILVSSASENIDEIGIFHASSADQAEKLHSAAEAYLANLLEEKGAFIASYAPLEVDKLEKAQVNVYGNYVAYAILSQKGRNSFFSAVEGKLCGIS